MLLCFKRLECQRDHSAFDGLRHYAPVHMLSHIYIVVLLLHSVQREKDKQSAKERWRRKHESSQPYKVNTRDGEELERDRPRHNGLVRSRRAEATTQTRTRAKVDSRRGWPPQNVRKRE